MYNIFIYKLEIVKKIMGEKRAVFPPVLYASGNSLPEAWENAYLELADKGGVYTRQDPEDNFGPQVAAVMSIVVENPDANPFTHMKGGTNAVGQPLLDYYYEMMGAKNSWIGHGWDYLYDTRLSEWDSLQVVDGKPVAGKHNQIEWAKQRLATRPFSRRTNMVTWRPEIDATKKDTPCLQRVWAEIITPESGEWGVDFHYEFRSRNVVDASFGNMQGLYMRFCDMRAVAEEKLERPLAMRMVEYVDSYHVNSKSYPRFQGIVKAIKAKQTEGGLENRTQTRAEVLEGIEGARGEVERVILNQTAKYFTGDMKQEEARVRAIGDRIFYLLDRYKP